jgi:putative Ca2+/H+ antiporter (TMEM165/GDT1 family)
MNEDPLYKLRHALAGVAIATLLSVLAAAWLGAFIGDLFGDSYALRAGTYAGLVLYIAIGAAVLFARVARYETRPLSVQRVALWIASLWIWPGLWWLTRKR